MHSLKNEHVAMNLSGTGAGVHRWPKLQRKQSFILCAQYVILISYTQYSIHNIRYI